MAGEALTDVVPVRLDHARALLLEPDSFRDRFGLTLVPGFLAFPEALPHTLQALEAGADPEWSSHLIVDRAAAEVVGFGGFTGPPSQDGEVEIGYSIAPQRQGRGHATAAARRWRDRARAAGVRRMLAHTLPEQNPSTGVLRRVGFHRDGTATDQDVGEVWRWVLDLDGGSDG